MIVVVLAIINVPFALHEWQQHRAKTDGVPVTATVVGVTPSGDDAVVTFRLPKSVDEKQAVRTVKVNGDGQVRSWGGLIITVVADLLVVAMLLLSWRLGGRIRRPTLVGIAVEDVASGSQGSVLDKQEDGTYLINGEVAETGPASLVLTLRDRNVEINLRDHQNPIAVGEWARVRAQLVG